MKRIWGRLILVLLLWFLACEPAVASSPTPTPTGIPDISVSQSELTYTPATPKAGIKVNLKAKVRNLGTGKAGNFVVRFYNSDSQIYEKKITSLSKNSVTTVTYQYLVPVSTKQPINFKVIADTDKTVTESNEDNNQAIISVPVVPASNNLILESFKPSATSPKPGQKISWQFKIRNSGTTKIQNFKITLYTDKNSTDPTSTLNIASLNPGALTTKSISWTVPTNLTPAINYPVLGKVDAENKVEEFNETDNTKTYALSLKVGDLKIEPGQYFRQTSPTYANTFEQIWVKIKNDNVTEQKNVKVAIYFAKSKVDGPRTKVMETTVTVPKNGEVAQMFDRVFLANNLPVGTLVYAFAVIDPDNQMAESNKTNNELMWQRTVIERPPQAQSPYIYITVFNEEGNRQNNATIKLTDTSQSNNPKTKVTGADPLVQNSAGNVVFDALAAPTGKYTVSITTPGYRTQTETWDFNRDKDETVYKTFDLDKKAVVIGTVKNQAGSPLPYVSVKLEGTGLETLTDAQGKYGFMVNGGTYTLRFVKIGYSRIIEPNISVPALATVTLDKTMAPATTGYVAGSITNDEGNGLANVDIYVNGQMIGVTSGQGGFVFGQMSTGNKNFKFKKPNYVDTEFSQEIEAGGEYLLNFAMYKPSTDTHVERGTQIVSWHQHEGTPANGFFIPEYNVDVWWGLFRTKMGLDFTKTGDTAKLTKLIINNHGQEWECHKVEGEGDVETSAIDIPITIAAGGCSDKTTQVDVYKVTVESNGVEVFADEGYWSSASDPNNTGTRVLTLNNLAVDWNSNFKVKMWLRVQKKAVMGTDGDGSGALYGYHLDKKLITWYPQKPPSTIISTSWGQVGSYLLGILDNPVTAITNFTDLFTVDRYTTYTIEEVLPANFPGSPPNN